MPAPDEYTPEYGAAIEQRFVALGQPEFDEDGGPTEPPPEPELVIPPTKPYVPTPGFDASGSFRFVMSNADTGVAWFDADYIAHGMPYLYSDFVAGNHDHAWWVPGDREGYATGYGLLYDKHPNPLPEPFATEHGLVQRDPDEGHFIHRVTFGRPPGTTYSKISDKYMEEGKRYYDGTPYTGGGMEIPDQDAAKVSASPFKYENDTRPGHENIRIGLWRERPAGVFEIADIRDFNGLDIHSDNIKFRHIPEITESPDGQGQRIAVVMYENDIPGVLIYYDALDNGHMTIEYDGA